MYPPPSTLEIIGSWEELEVGARKGEGGGGLHLFAAALGQASGSPMAQCFHCVTKHNWRNLLQRQKIFTRITWTSVLNVMLDDAGKLCLLQIFHQIFGATDILLTNLFTLFVTHLTPETVSQMLVQIRKQT